MTAMTAGKPRSSNAKTNAKPKYPEFGKWFLATARAALYDVDTDGWQAELARDAEVEPASIGRYVKGEVRPGPKNCQKLARPLRINPDDMLAHAGHRATGADPDAQPAPVAVTRAGREVDEFLTDPRTSPELAARIERAIADAVQLGRMANGTAG
jgi:transcriptional regulator with XRE-family HTH domain